MSESNLLRVAKLVLKRLGELNRDDESGMRLVLAQAIAEAEATLTSTKEQKS